MNSFQTIAVVNSGGLGNPRYVFTVRLLGRGRAWVSRDIDGCDLIQPADEDCFNLAARSQIKVSRREDNVKIGILSP